jgi:hypothetical protein
MEDMTFEKMLEEAQGTERLEDPRCGKHENAVLLDNRVIINNDGGMWRLELTWGGLQDAEGQEFTHVQRIFFPRVDDPPFMKIRFMSALKALGIVPAAYKDMLYIDTEEKAALLEMKIGDLLGQEWPITISLDGRGFLNTTIRNRPKQRAS